MGPVDKLLPTPVPQPVSTGFSATWASSRTLRVGVTDTKIHKNDPTKDMKRRVEMIPAGRMASPDEIANIIFWLGSDQNTFTTGQVISSSGGE